MEKKNKILTEEHHRRPRSLGGITIPGNISYVISSNHDNQHTLFGNMNASQIADQINKFPYKPDGFMVVCKFINGTEVKLTGENNSKSKSKIHYSWNSLFKDLEFIEIIKYINNVWLDPSYHLYIEKIS